MKALTWRRTRPGRYVDSSYRYTITRLEMHRPLWRTYFMADEIGLSNTAQTAKVRAEEHFERNRV